MSMETKIGVVSLVNFNGISVWLQIRVSLILVWCHIFVEIDHEIISIVILLRNNMKTGAKSSLI